MSFGPKNFDDPEERLFYESLVSSNLGDWAVRDYYRAKGELHKYFNTETHRIPVGVRHGSVTYENRTILILKKNPEYRMTMENFTEVATELAKLGVDIIAWIIPKLVEQRKKEHNTGQLCIDFTEPDHITNLAGLA